MSDIHFEKPSDYTLSQIISVYEARRGGTPYLETHKVLSGSKGMMLGAGKPLTKKILNGLLAVIIGKESLRPTGYIPQDVLAFAQDVAGESNFAFWLPPCKAVLHHSKISKPLVVPYPGLVFFENRGSLSVFVVKGGQRPTLDTPLYQPPFWNVNRHTGSVCTGNCKRPNKLASLLDRIEGWKALWFKSEFTHDLNEEYGKTTLGKLWQGLDNKNKFPEKILQDANKTLRFVLNSTGLA
ncbi:MAG: hypothetical protein A2511_05775 [Deltaproteobacteria bacterium RIFOXYD12_FULL_50_9]|nr:MAG: hypothetical protein A2511_05775 [Deltaproteobacteria bacterium RIFOXYD12_FULL_50_9]